MIQLQCVSDSWRAAAAGKSAKRSAHEGVPLRLPGVCAFALIGLSAVAKACKASGTTSERLGRLSEALAMSLLAFGPAATRAGAHPVHGQRSPSLSCFQHPSICSALACPETRFVTTGQMRLGGCPGYGAAWLLSEARPKEQVHVHHRGHKLLLNALRRCSLLSYT